MLLDFLKEARLDRVGCFKYSPVEGATANELADQVPEEVKEERWNRFMQLQQQISAERLQEKWGAKSWCWWMKLMKKAPLAAAWPTLRKSTARST
jgi:tRNA A37 methylthiotransferase MiaB